MPKTKIVCTIGPASNNVTTLRKMMQTGMDFVRLNCSHGSHKSMQQTIERVRELNKKYRRRIRILLDLEGFRIRIGDFSHLKTKTVELKKKQTVKLTGDPHPRAKDTIPFDYQGELRDIKKGSMIFIDDGNLALEVTRSTQKYLKTQVLVGGILKQHKGVNIPNVALRFKSLTENDKQDLLFAIEHNVDYIAQSFVRGKQDMHNIRRFINKRDFDSKLIAKIENRQGIKNIDSILDVADGIMIARGDMGVSLPIWEVPIVQKMIIKKCSKRRKLSITATQMLESMTENLRPTRAEVSDIANAVFDGTDCVMLSAESAVGKHPVESVKMMNNIIKFAEKN